MDWYFYLQSRLEEGQLLLLFVLHTAFFKAL